MSTKSLVLVSVVGFVACSETAMDLDGGTPDAGMIDGGSVGVDATVTSSLAVGWSVPSHGADGDPDYATVFPDDRANRIDIVIRAADWAAMQADLEMVVANAGSFDYFQRLDSACRELALGDACEVTMLGRVRSGTCQQFFEQGLTCDVGPFETFACESKQAGDVCKDIFTGGEGTCTQQFGSLICVGGDGFGDGDYAAADFWAGMKPSYVPCLLSMGDKTWPHVGVRYKGNNSLASSVDYVKKPLRLKFDEFEKVRPEIANQRFYGFQHLSLGNNVVDEPYLRQRAAVELFATGGVPTPAVAFYRVFVDHGDGPTYWGLYTMTEVPDDPFLDRTFGNVDGNLYKPDGRGARFAEYVEASYHKKNNKKAADFSDIQRFVAALNGSVADRASWRTNLEATFDMMGFIQFWAANQAIANWDTYGALAHNYYLYADGGGALKFIPWDFDLSLDGTGSDMNVLDPVALVMFGQDGEWPLLRAIAEDPVYRMAYDEQLRIFEMNAFSTTGIDDDIRAWHALIRPYVVGPEGERPGVARAPSAGDFDQALMILLEHLTAQRTAVRQYLESR